MTQIQPIKSDESLEQWDTALTRLKRGDLWTGATFLFGSQHTEQTAMAAVKRIRDKTAAKKQARQTGFFDVNQLSDGKACTYQPTRGVVYDMSSFLQHAVDKYCQLAGPEFQHLKKVSTLLHDDKIARPVDTDAESKGKLAPVASRVLMKLLFAAIIARFDLLRAVQGLASKVTKWSIDCDKALHSLVCYATSTMHCKMQSFIGDDVKACKLWLLANSDHAGEHDNKSMSGGFLALVGPNTYQPFAAFSKKQTSSAVSATEAEVVCANVALRALGLPSSALWSVLQNAGGGTPFAITRLAAVSVNKQLPDPDPSFHKITNTGQYSLDDGRIVFAKH